MIGDAVRKFIREHRHIDLPIARVYPRGSVSGRQSVDRRLLDRLRADLLLLAHPGEDAGDVAVEIVAVRCERKLRLPALAVDRHGARAIDHVEALRCGEGEPQFGMDELTAFDHALRRVVAISQPVDPGEEGIAIGDAATDARGLRGRHGALHAAGRIGVGRCPFGNAGIVAALDPRIERVLHRQALQDGCHRARIIARLVEIADTEFVGFEFLRTREFQRQQLRTLQCGLADLLPKPAIAEQDARQDGTCCAKQRIALRGGLAALRMARGDMADLVPEHAGQFGFIVHQRDQLARRVDIATGDRESVVHRAVEQRNRERFARIAKPGLNRNVLAHLLDILRMAAANRAAEFGEQLRMRFGAHLCFALRNRGGCARNVAPAHAAGQRQRQSGDGGGGGKSDARHKRSPRLANARGPT